MAQGRATVRLAGATAIMLAAVGLSTGSAQAAAASERADTLSQARDDAAIKVGATVSEPLATAGDKDWFRYVIPKRSRAVITLAGLPADYNLAVYRSDGTRIAVSDHPAKGFERIFFTADAATYFVRVASTKGHSSAKYKLRLRTLSAPLALLSFSVPKVNSGYPWVVGEFVNTTDKWQRVDFVAVNSIAADGRILQKDGVNLQQWRVAPYGLLHVASSTSLPLPAGYDHLQLGATIKPLDAVSLSGLKRVSGATVTRDGYRVHTGTVKNTTSVTRGGDDDNSGVSVDVAYYNANGTLIGTALTNVKTMAPGQTVKYSATAKQSEYWVSPFPTPNRYEVRLLAAW
jgi:hypothetical protein